MPQEQEEWDEQAEEFEGDVIDVNTSEEESLEDYLHTLEYDDGLPDLLVSLNCISIETKAGFLYRLKWYV